jgi:biofilm PGA synthesis N-glycosyltransferase PgaC
MHDVTRSEGDTPMQSAEPDSVRYAIVTPVKNEEKFLPEMIDSVVNQTVRPREWIIVDDGSTDRTVVIIQRAVATHEWIRCVRIDHAGGRQPGGEGALPTGLRLLDLSTCGFFARLDADISFQPDYFEKLFDEFRNNPRLGIATGVCWARQGGRLVEEKHPRFHTRGPLKTYRVACFEQIGSLERVLGWDIVDEARANMLGWQTRSFRHLRVIHQRPTQTAGGRLKGCRNVGHAAYFTGYHPLFLLARAVNTMPRRPYVLGGIFVGLGYLHGYVARKPQVNDPALIRYVRQQQLNRLTGRETIWK